jgi:hypothetical protein
MLETLCSYAHIPSIFLWSLYSHTEILSGRNVISEFDTWKKSGIFREECSTRYAQIKQSKHNTIIVIKMLPTKSLTACVRSCKGLSSGKIIYRKALLRWKRPLYHNSAFLCIHFCIVSPEDGSFHGLNHVVSVFCR